MKTYKGGETAKGGFYFNLTTKDIFTLEKDGMLPGQEKEHYFRVPVLLMLVGGPILGLFYVMFLPFISFAMVLMVLFQKASAGVRQLDRKLAKLATAEWRPGVAYFAWRKASRQSKKQLPEVEKPKGEDLITELEQEISEQRKEGRQ
jgi:hypothetical protein